jgi:hypothetical protein
MVRRAGLPATRCQILSPIVCTQGRIRDGLYAPTALLRGRECGRSTTSGTWSRSPNACFHKCGESDWHVAQSGRIENLKRLAPSRHVVADALVLTQAKYGHGLHSPIVTYVAILQSDVTRQALTRQIL